MKNLKNNIDEGFFDNIGTTNANEYGELIVHMFTAKTQFNPIASYVPDPHIVYDAKTKSMIISSGVYKDIVYKVDLSRYITGLLGFDDVETVKKILQRHCNYSIRLSKGTIIVSTRVDSASWNYGVNDYTIKKHWPAPFSYSTPMIESPVYLCQSLTTYINSHFKEISMGRGDLKELKAKLQEVIDKI